MTKIPSYFKGLKPYPCCDTHCRDWRETKGGKIPASNHSPACENYKPIKFLNLYFENLEDGFTIELKDLYSMMETFLPEDIVSVKIEQVFMTQDQYEKLPEFQGF